MCTFQGASWTAGICVLLITVGSTAGQNAPVRQCVASGTICHTCDTQALCVSDAGGNFTKILQPCDAGEMCVYGVCVQGTLCNYRPFACTDSGFFPDPYDCQVYHACIRTPSKELLKNTLRCAEMLSYDALTESCVPRACLVTPVPECYFRLQLGALPSNPSLYYICTQRNNTLAPELYKCPAGRTFSETAISCI